MSYSEFNAVIELLDMLIFNWRTGSLFLLLIVAAVTDVRQHRIPNWLVMSGTVFGIFYNLYSPPFPHAGLIWPLEGLGMGFMVFFPMYLLRIMGAGDVKLMAMVGAFLGPVDMLWALLCTMIAGGVLSIFLVLARGTVRRMLNNIKTIFSLGYLSIASGMRPDVQLETATSAGKLPYGVAIASGTMFYLVFHQLNLL